MKLRRIMLITSLGTNIHKAQDCFILFYFTFDVQWEEEKFCYTTGVQTVVYGNAITINSSLYGLEV